MLVYIDRYILVPVNVDCILFVFGVYKTKYSVTMADVASRAALWIDTYLFFFFSRALSYQIQESNPSG